MDGQIGPLARAVDREEPQGHDSRPEEMVVHVTEQLGLPFRRRVGRDRAAHGVILGERHVRAVPVDRGGGAKHEAPDLHLAGVLEEHLSPSHVHVLIEEGLLDRRSDSRPCREVHDAIDRIRDRLAKQVLVPYVALDESKLRPLQGP